MKTIMQKFSVGKFFSQAQAEITPFADIATSAECKLNTSVGVARNNPFFRSRILGDAAQAGTELRAISRSKHYLKMRPVQSDINMFTAPSFRLISAN